MRLTAHGVEVAAEERREVQLQALERVNDIVAKEAQLSGAGVCGRL
jgi:hypothetical protein